MRSVVLAGGGTAGHVEPALALADALRAGDPDLVVTLLGTATGLEARLVPARGYELATIPRVPLPRTPTPTLLTVPARLNGAVRAAGEVLDRTSADVVVGFGGYVSVPAYLAARRRRIPVVVHEANPLPGVANRLGARLTPFVAVSHPDTPLRGARLTGVPLRPALLELDRSAPAAAAARVGYGLDPDRPTLLVFGGSQGARRLNDVVVEAARILADAGIQVLHAAGPKNADDVLRALPRDLSTPWEVRPYLDRIDSAYAAADLALCRSGAMTCAELAAVGLPAAYVPLPHGNGEQRLNALPTVRAGGGLLVDDADLSADWIRRELVPALADPRRLAQMSAATSTTGFRDAAQRLVALVQEAAASGSASGSAPPERPRRGRHAAH